MVHSTQGPWSFFFIVLPIPRINLLQESPVSCPVRFLPDTGGEPLFRSDAQFRQHIRLTSNQGCLFLRKLPQRILVSREAACKESPIFSKVSVNPTSFS